MSSRSTLACVGIALASAALCGAVEPTEDAAATPASAFNPPPPSEPRIYSPDDVYAERPAEAVTVEFRVLSTGTHHTERYAAIHEAQSPPIVLGSRKAVPRQEGPYLQIVLVGDALTAVENLGLDSLHFKNRVVKANGIVHQVQERWPAGPRVRCEIVVDDLKHLQIVSERSAGLAATDG